MFKKITFEARHKDGRRKKYRTDADYATITQWCKAMGLEFRGIFMLPQGWASPPGKSISSEQMLDDIEILRR